MTLDVVVGQVITRFYQFHVPVTQMYSLSREGEGCCSHSSHHPREVKGQRYTRKLRKRRKLARLIKQVQVRCLGIGKPHGQPLVPNPSRWTSYLALSHLKVTRGFDCQTTTGTCSDLGSTVPTRYVVRGIRNGTTCEVLALGP